MEQNDLHYQEGEQRGATNGREEDKWRLDEQAAFGQGIAFPKRTFPPLGQELYEKLKSLEAEKYFTPSIEDIRVGYELETWAHDFLKGFFWMPYTVDGKIKFDQIVKAKNRVSYLTKEQIEGEGWKTVKDLWTREGYMLAREKKEVIRIYQVGREGSDINSYTIYLGECKDVNTLRMIMKLLGISKELTVS